VTAATRYVSRYLEPRTARVVTLVSHGAWEQKSQVVVSMLVLAQALAGGPVVEPEKLSASALAIRQMTEDLAHKQLSAFLGPEGLRVEHRWSDEVEHGAGRLVSVGRTPGRHVIERAP
jgi:hypothetical protein